MKVVVSDQKTGKAYMGNSDHDLFLGKKIGEIAEYTAPSGTFKFKVESISI